MNRTVACRAVSLAMLVLLGSQFGVTAGGLTTAPAPSPGTLSTPVDGPSEPASADRPPGVTGAEVTWEFSSLGSTAGPLVSWVDAVLQSGASLGAEYRIAPPTVLVVGGAHRPNDEPTFENELRASVYRAITESPGRYTADLSAETGAPESTVRYHVRVLEDENLIESAVIRGKRRFYPPAMDRRAVEVEAAVTDESTGPILDAVAQLEPASVSAIAAAVDAAPSTVSYHLQQLADRGLVDRERTGQAVVTRLEAPVRTRLGVDE